MRLTEEERRFLQMIHNLPKEQLEEIFASVGLLEEYRRIVEE